MQVKHISSLFANTNHKIELNMLNLFAQGNQNVNCTQQWNQFLYIVPDGDIPIMLICLQT